MAAKRMCQDCQQFIEKKSKILDLGCGSGIVGKAFQDFFQSQVIGVDIIDRRVFKIPFKKIDGNNLPFLKNDFDTILITYVLHHAQNPEALLKEAKRVAKGRILIYEDLSEGLTSKLVCKLHGVSFDKFVGNKNKTRFRTEKEWREIFEKLQLRLVFHKRVNSALSPIKKKLFVLEKMGTPR